MMSRRVFRRSRTRRADRAARVRPPAETGPILRRERAEVDRSERGGERIPQIVDQHPAEEVLLPLQVEQGEVMPAHDVHPHEPQPSIPARHVPAARLSDFRGRRRRGSSQILVRHAGEDLPADPGTLAELKRLGPPEIGSSAERSLGPSNISRRSGLSHSSSGSRLRSARRIAGRAVLIEDGDGPEPAGMIVCRRLVRESIVYCATR